MFEFINQLKHKVADKVVQTAKEAASDLINTGAAKAAEAIGQHLGTPVDNKNQQVIADYQKKNYFEQMLTQQQQQNSASVVPPPVVPPPVIPPVPPPDIPAPIDYPPAYGYPPYYYPSYPPAQMTVQAPVIKLEEEKVKRMAQYETDLFFRGKKIGKDVIRFAGIKYFSRKVDEDLETIRAYETTKNPALEGAYKNARYNVAKLEAIQQISYEDDNQIRDFIYEVILDGMMKKNEAGKLSMPSIWEVGLKDLGFFAYEVFTPNQSIDLLLESLTEKFHAATSDKS
ncbi:hypothetical protein [Emticicia sp. 17c]|uniref:hypothetical protein n=1 Tax=Emticicia sp. 17c TaxID=3127704 RepID=UPI00301C2B22